MRVQGSGFRVQGSWFVVQGSGFRVQGSEFKVQGPGFRVEVSGCGVYQRGHAPDHLRRQGGGWWVERARERERETDRERKGVGLMRTSETTHHTISGARTSSHDLQRFGSRVQDLGVRG